MSKPGTDLFSTDRGDEFQIRPHPENKSVPIYTENKSVPITKIFPHMKKMRASPDK
jgi:hypothetical protein